MNNRVTKHDRVWSGRLAIPKFYAPVEIGTRQRQACITHWTRNNYARISTSPSKYRDSRQWRHLLHHRIGTPSDVDPSAFHIPSDKDYDVEFDVAHNWVRQADNDKRRKRFQTRRHRLQILFPDDDPLATIEDRLDEVKAMLKPKAELSTLLQNMDPVQRELIETISQTNTDTLRKRRRRSWKIRDYFRYAVRIVMIMSHACGLRRRYYEQQSLGKSEEARKKQNRRDRGNVTRSSFGLDMLFAVTTNPQFRKSLEIKRALWVLNATKAFNDLFPAEMENELARVVSYEKYDDSRVMAYQGCPPDRLYFILSGRVHLLREFVLAAGTVTKSIGYLHKGMTTDTEELIKRWPREENLITKGPVEVLVIHRTDFLRLKHTTEGPPIEYLQSLDLFMEFPCDIFLENPDMLDFVYYGQNKVIERDSDRTPWIYVVKSGAVKVVRIQHVIDVRSDTQAGSQVTTDAGKAYKEEGDKLDFLSTQPKMKTAGQITLHELTKRRKDKPKSVFKLKFETLKPIYGEDEMEERHIVISTPDQRESTRTPYLERKSIPNQPIITVSRSSSVMDDNLSVVSKKSRSRRVSVLPPLINVPRRPSRVSGIDDDGDENFHPHGTFLTREKTGFDPVYVGKRRADTMLRRAYIQLDLLHPGDIFGLVELSAFVRYQDEGLAHEEDILPDGPGVSLVSDGAEVIKINKRFFLQNAQNNTMLRIEAQQREYISSDDAKHQLYNQDTWTMYKTGLMKRIIRGLTPKS